MPVAVKDSNRVVLQLGTKKYAVTEAEHSKLQAILTDVWRPKVGHCKVQLAEIRAAWDAHAQARKDTFFLVPAIVDKLSPAKFPPESIVTKAQAAVGRFEAAVKAGDPGKCTDAFEAAVDTTHEALRAIRAYHEGIIEGAGKAVRFLEVVRDGSGVIMQVSAAFASGGASSVLTASVVSASAGSYEELVRQIEKASGPERFEPWRAVGTVIIKGSVEGLTTTLFAEAGVASKFLDRAAKRFAGKSLDLMLTRKVLEKAWKKSLEEGAKSVIGDLIAKHSYDKGLTLDKAFDHAIEKMRIGFVLGSLDEKLEALAKENAKYLRPEWFKGLGKVDYEKAMKNGGEKVISMALEKIAPRYVLDAAGNPQRLEFVHEEVAKAVASDPKVIRELSVLAKKR